MHCGVRRGLELTLVWLGREEQRHAESNDREVESTRKEEERERRQEKKKRGKGRKGKKIR